MKRTLDGKWTLEIQPPVSFYALFVGCPKLIRNPRKRSFLQRNRFLKERRHQKIRDGIQRTRQCCHANLDFQRALTTLIDDDIVERVRKIAAENSIPWHVHENAHVHEDVNTAPSMNNEETVASSEIPEINLDIVRSRL